MKRRAYVLIDADKRGAGSIVAELDGKLGIISADSVFGHHDVVAVIEADDMEGLVKIVRNEISQAEGVIHTETLLVHN